MLDHAPLTFEYAGRTFERVPYAPPPHVRKRLSRLVAYYGVPPRYVRWHLGWLSYWHSRSAVKVVAFGAAYGASRATLLRTLDRQAAESALDRFRAAYPHIKKGQ